MRSSTLLPYPVVAALVVLIGSLCVRADDESAADAAAEPDPFANQRFTPPSGLVRLSKEHDIWLDTKRKRVVFDGVVCLTEGQLEMFACPRQTKEHESVVAVDCLAREVHAGLIAVGAKSGRPARFEPEYSPAQGSVIDIQLLWYDKDRKKHSTRAQNWVRDVKTKQAMKYDWVFAGSGFWTDPENGDQFYHGDAGDFICVSNFPSATLDVPVESPKANNNLLFESFTENIPPKGTPVRLVLTPRPAKKESDDAGVAKQPAEAKEGAAKQPE